jgi:DNA-binding CsgD family transcriptional regulator
VAGAAALPSDEREVAAMIASGKTSKEIAGGLYLSEKRSRPI